MDTLQALFENNHRWSDRMRELDPEFFQKLCGQQAPRYLWIGCADSRVPANEIVGLMPGELFVHRNVANLVIHTDFNCLSVIHYAVEVLGVEHIIVCGHYGCGGVEASLRPPTGGLVSNWLHHLRDLGEAHRAELDALPAGARADRLCELNVRRQVIHVARTTMLRDAWAAGRRVAVHGLIYALGDGRLRRLLDPVDSPETLQEIVTVGLEERTDTD